MKEQTDGRASVARRARTAAILTGSASVVTALLVTAFGAKLPPFVGD